MDKLIGSSGLDRRQLIWLMTLESQRYQVLSNGQLARELAIPLSGDLPKLKALLGEDFTRAAESVAFRADLAQQGYAQRYFSVSQGQREYLFLLTAEMIGSELLRLPAGETQDSLMYIGVLTDLSELVQKDERFKREVAAYLEALALKDKFLSQISHELRTPLNGIAGMSQLLDMTTLDDEQREYIRILRTASSRMNRLIGNLIHYTHLFSGMKQSEGKQQIQLRELFRQVIEAQKSDLADKELSVEISISPTVDSLITLNAASLEIALDQLLDNAVKFSREGQITLNASSDEADEGLLVIEIQDEGLGFDPTLYALEKRLRQDAPPSANGSGLGLGLLIVKRLEELGDLRCHMESKRGFGTKAVIKMPFASESLSQQSRQEKKKLYLGKKALVVDDDENGRVILSVMSKKLGMGYDIAENGREALELAKHSDYDIVYLDIQMPEINGIEVLAQMRDMPAHRHTPIVAVTAYALKGDEEKFLASGFDGYIAKPVEASRFEAITSRMLQLKY